MARLAEPDLDARREPAAQRDAVHTEGAEPGHQRVDVARGHAQQVAGDRIVARCMLDDERREGAVVARRRGAHPAHDRVRVGLELGGDGPQQAGPGNAPIVRPQRPADRLATEPGAAALIGDREAPAADPMLPLAACRPSDSAGADDHDAAIAAAMSTDAGGVRVGRHQRAAKRERVLLGGRQIGRLTGTGERKAGDDVVLVGEETSLCERARRRCAHGGETLVEAEPDVGRAGRALTQDGAVAVA